MTCRPAIAKTAPTVMFVRDRSIARFFQIQDDEFGWVRIPGRAASSPVTGKRDCVRFLTSRITVGHDLGDVAAIRISRL